MKRKLRVIVPLMTAVIFFGVMTANAHLFWVETDLETTGSPSIEVRIFLGHPDMPETNIVPELAKAVVYLPDGNVSALTLKKEKDHQKAMLRLDLKGIHMISSAREPGIFDPKWHDGKGPVRLTKDFTKLIVINGPAIDLPCLNTGMDLEIVPTALPEGLKTGGSFKAIVLFKGKPVKAEYSAAQASVNMHDSQAIQMGVAENDGSFSVGLDKEGMWVVMVEYNDDESGVWDASHDLIYKGKTYYSKGEKRPYGLVKYRSTLTFYVKGI